jgi:transcriptional regulator with XRE-family HTH domain
VFSIGEKLRSARESKKLTFKDVSKDTNITPKFIEALENEEFEKFPGETYVIGFLRTYAEYLRVDAEEIVHAYKGYKIGESATPLEELTKPTRTPIFMSLSDVLGRHKNVLYISGIVSVLLVVIWLFSSIFSSNIEMEGDDSIKNIKSEYDKAKKTEIENIRNLQLMHDSGYILVYTNEAVQFLVDNKEVMFLLNAIKENSVLIELLPGNIVEKLEIEKPKVLNIKDCPREVVFTLKGLTENRAKIMVMLGKRLEAEKEIAEEKVEKLTGEDSTKVTAQSEKSLRIVFEAEFIKNTYIELYLDGMKKNKGIVFAGKKERWEATEYIQLKIGNAGGLKARINGKEYTFGLPGQVANKVITWKKDIKDPNVYHIVVKDW